MVGIKDVTFYGLGELYILLGDECLKAIIDKNQVKSLYIEGFTDSEIAKKLDAKKDTIKKCIQRNFDYLKAEHNIAKTCRREVVRAVNYEANKYIGDSSFVKKNRSIYKTKKNGDIIIDRKVAPVVTWDTPKRLANENRVR